ncbi:hypothetical protein PENTCL1PPCAC_7870, partial [Pristionchus entomophagus]
SDQATNLPSKIGRNRRKAGARGTTQSASSLCVWPSPRPDPLRLLHPDILPPVLYRLYCALNVTNPPTDSPPIPPAFVLPYLLELSPQYRPIEYQATSSPRLSIASDVTSAIESWTTGSVTEMNAVDEQKAVDHWPICGHITDLINTPSSSLPAWIDYKEKIDHALLQMEQHLQQEFRRLEETGVYVPLLPAPVPPFERVPSYPVVKKLAINTGRMDGLNEERLLLVYHEQKRKLSRLCSFLRDIEKAVYLPKYRDLRPGLDANFSRLMGAVRVINEIISASPLNQETLSDPVSKRRRKAADAETRRQKDVENALVRLGRDAQKSSVPAIVQIPPHRMFIPGVEHFPGIELKSADCYFRPLNLTEEREKNQNSPDSGLPASPNHSRTSEHVVTEFELPLVLEIDSEGSYTESESVCSTSREPSPLTMEEEMERRKMSQMECERRQKETDTIREGFRKKVEEAIGPEKIAERKVTKPASTSNTASPSFSPSPSTSSTSPERSRESSLLRDLPDEETDDSRELRLFMEAQLLDVDQIRQQKMVAIWRAWLRGISILRKERKEREADKKEKAIQRRHDLIMEIVAKKEKEKEERELRAWEEQQELLQLELAARELLQQERARQAQQSAMYLREMEAREAAQREHRAAKEEEKKRKREEAQRKAAEKASLEEEKKKKEEGEKRLAEEERARVEREEDEKRRETERIEREKAEAERQRQLTLDRETRKAEERKQKEEAAEKKRKEEEEKSQKAIEKKIEEHRKKRKLAERMDKLIEEEAKREAERRRLEREEQAVQRREEQQKIRTLALQRAQEEKARQGLSLDERLRREEEEKKRKMEEIQSVVDTQLTPPISPTQKKANAKRRSAKKIQSTISEDLIETDLEKEARSAKRAEEREESEVDEFQVAIPKNSRKKEAKFEPKIYVPVKPELNEKDKKAVEKRKAFQEREAKEQRRRETLERTSKENSPDASKSQGNQKQHYTKKEKLPTFSREWIEFRNRRGEMSPMMHCLIITALISLGALGIFSSWNKTLGIRQDKPPKDFVCPNLDSNRNQDDDTMEFPEFLVPLEEMENKPDPD